MPLDPFFAERLRVHRRHLYDKARGAMRARLMALLPFGRSAPAADPSPVDESRPIGREGSIAPPLGPRARARARNRAAAIAWDCRELKAVGTRGPRIPITEHELTADGVPPFRVRIYHPAEPGETLVPGCLALFGGAFRIGGIDYPTTDAGNRRRAADSGVAMVAVDYALAPEHQFPTQIEQAYAALVWLFEHGAEVGVDPQRIGILGTSAGGNIATAVTLMNRDRRGLPIRLQVLEVPVTDLTGGHIDLAATRALGIPSFIAKRELRSVVRTYLPHLRDAKKPYASPLLADSHEGLPPAVVLTAEYDPLRGDGAAYTAALRAAGVEASAVRYLGVTHDTPIFTGVLPAARRWHDEIVTALRRLHE
ncbi:alpha/beta hydrolase [Microbacterium sp. AZCO]|uniref:alpha/beta hydrolase n=1 Tax=Microbacterium sp. AZCO TaxID=3142976 RepID=UPI0031F45E08